jgi:hypothetical protein
MENCIFVSDYTARGDMFTLLDKWERLKEDKA